MALSEGLEEGPSPAIGPIRPLRRLVRSPAVAGALAAGLTSPVAERAEQTYDQDVPCLRGRYGADNGFQQVTGYLRAASCPQACQHLRSRCPHSWLPLSPKMPWLSNCSSQPGSRTVSMSMRHPILPLFRAGGLPLRGSPSR